VEENGLYPEPDKSNTMFFSSETAPCVEYKLKYKMKYIYIYIYIYIYKTQSDTTLYFIKLY